MKSNHEYINGQIPYSEVNNFIEPIAVNLNMQIQEASNFFGHDMIDFKDFRSLVVENYASLIRNYVPSIKHGIYRLATVTYTSHLDGYDFRLHPIDFINNIFKIYGIKHEIPYIDLDDQYGFACFNDYVNIYTNDVLNNTDDRVIIDTMIEIKSNIRAIEELYNADINTFLNERSIPKDIIFYLSYKSLKEYQDTKNPAYTVMPYEYFYNVSHMQTSQYPHKVRVNDYYQAWYPDFRLEYLQTLGQEYVPSIEDFELAKNNIVIGVEILKPGAIDKKLTDIVARVRANPNVDYDKYTALFEKKINFYKSSPYTKNIVGIYGLNGYYGFAYPNEYLVFDKFYNSETIIPTRRTILTHGEAIYALPSDRFGVITKTKQDIIIEKEFDERIKKINHNDTFIERVEPIIYGPNVSTSTLNKELDIYKKKMLIRYN